MSSRSHLPSRETSPLGSPRGCHSLGNSPQRKESEASETENESEIEDHEARWAFQNEKQGLVEHARDNVTQTLDLKLGNGIDSIELSLPVRLVSDMVRLLLLDGYYLLNFMFNGEGEWYGVASASFDYQLERE